MALKRISEELDFKINHKVTKVLQNIGESKEELLCDKEVEGDDFITSGDGVFPSDPAVTLAQVNGSANPLCCAMNPDDSLLVTGGADGSLSLFKWGLALAPGEESSVKAVDDAVKIPCGAPPICCAFASVDSGRSFPVVAAGCMDGYVRLAYCGNDLDTSKSGIDRILLPKAASGTGINENGIKHGRYVKSVCWSPSEPILASASADGTISLSWRLVMAPPSCFEAVVVHELAHLRANGHGPKFRAVVERHLPDEAVRMRLLQRLAPALSAVR
jgi:hypothetical protein